ncbi:MAG: cytochrome P450 [Anaerolineae bacterium]|nr:cytochrome P450 [Anaerolineae bacterium]
MLSQNPEAEEKLHAELDAILQGRPPTLDDLPHLPYTQQVIKESMRLYPPAWILNGRVATANAEVGGYTIPKGSTLFISPYVMHRLRSTSPTQSSFRPNGGRQRWKKHYPNMPICPLVGGPGCVLVIRLR